MARKHTGNTADPTRYIGYIRVSTREQAGSGLGLAAQRAAILAAAEQRGWTVAAIHEDAGATGSNTDRAGLVAALDEVRSGQAAGIIVAKLDRLSRSLSDFARLMADARDRGWNLVALDLGVDLSTPAGRLVANVMASVAEWERDVISCRTVEALEVKRAQGVRLGRPVSLPEATRARVVQLRAAGLTMAAIATTLDAEGHQTARGGRWAPGTVHAVLRSVEADRVAA